MHPLILHSCPTLEIYSICTDVFIELPYFPLGVSAGFPSPAVDFVEQSIELNSHLIDDPATTFLVRVKGESMLGDDINNGDLLLVDKSKEYCNGDIAVCYIDGEFTLKRINLIGNECWLIPSNPKFNPIKLAQEDELTVWGVVTYAIKDMRSRKSQKIKT